MIETQRDAMQQALDALENCRDGCEESHNTVLAIATLRAAIAEPVVEPVATFDEVFDAIDWDVWRMQPIRELVRMIHSKTAPPPAEVPRLTDDESYVLYAQVMQGYFTDAKHNWVTGRASVFARAIEQAVRQKVGIK